MEKYSEQWWQTFTRNLKTKFEYLLSSEFDSKKYEIKDFFIDDIVSRKNGKIEEISFDITVDYLLSCEGNAYSFCQMTQTVSDDIYNFFRENKINPETYKFQKNAPGLVLEPIIIDMNFRLDEQHEYKLWVRIDYNE